MTHLQLAGGFLKYMLDKKDILQRPTRNLDRNSHIWEEKGEFLNETPCGV